MNDRDRAFQKMDTVRSVLERLPDEAVQHLCFYMSSSSEPEIQFFFDEEFSHVINAFPFTKPIRRPFGDDGEYDTEEFMVDGVRLFQLVKAGKPDPEARTHEDGAG